MEPIDGEDTVIRPSVPAIVAPGIHSPGVLDPGVLDDDTVIRERAPVADAPADAVPELAPHALIEPPRIGTQRLSEPPRPVEPISGLEPDTFHRFRVNTHEPISLDKPALLGRKPVAPRIPTGRPPRLVRVPSPRREVSGTHLELSQHGNRVVVTDLRSTNGTLVTIPGAETLKLRQGESVVVSTGTVVDIGDGNVVEILPVPRIVPSNL